MKVLNKYPVTLDMLKNSIESREFCLEVSGSMACFTNPSFKAQRCTYPVITPSSVKAIFAAIFDKPAIQWLPTKIEVLNEIDYLSFKKNELAHAYYTKSEPISIQKHRTQKTNTVLRDVKYRIYAKQLFIPFSERHEWPQENRSDETPIKYIEMFLRRAKNNQMYKTPYFGKNEYEAEFKFIEHPELEKQKPINKSEDFDVMYYGSLNYNINERIIFHSIMTNGVINIPDIREIGTSNKIQMVC